VVSANGAFLGGNMYEHTLCIIKPGTAQEGYDTWRILAALQEEFAIIRVKSFQFTPELAKEFYKEHDGKDFFPGLIEYSTSAPCIAVVLYGNYAISRYRQMAGNTNPDKAELGTLRCRFGRGIPNNAVHASDSPESAKREIKLIFGEEYEEEI
jgi:nucleoside-diphosphate kinase